MKYDDASWHYGGKFPKELPNEAGATHTGMFVAWALLAGLAGTFHITDFPEDLMALRERKVTPGAFFLRACDGKFTNEDLNDEGNAFTTDYFDFKKGGYLSDYEKNLGVNLPTLYHVADSWENFERIKPVLDRRLSAWRSTRAL